MDVFTRERNETGLVINKKGGRPVSKKISLDLKPYSDPSIGSATLGLYLTMKNFIVRLTNNTCFG